MERLSILFLNSVLLILFSQLIPSLVSAQSKPFVLGVIDEIHSVHLAENRVLNIYLPKGMILRCHSISCHILVGWVG
jgi:hypothetical protein